MKELMIFVSALFMATAALAQTPSPAKPDTPLAAAAPMGTGADCDAKAVGKDGKPLAGAAKASFLKKCKADAAVAAKAECETKAVGKDGKALAGAAKTSFVRKCVADAAGK